MVIAAGNRVRAADFAVDYLNAYVSSNVSPTTGGVGIPFAKQAGNGGSIALTGGSNYGFTVPRDGLYAIELNIRTDRDVSAADITISFRLNAGGSVSGGSAPKVTYPNVSSSNAGNFTSASGNTFFLEEGDTIEFFATSSSGTATDFIVTSTTTSRLTVHRVVGEPQLS